MKPDNRGTPLTRVSKGPGKLANGLPMVDFGAITVLVVDDNRFMRTLITGLLRAFNIERILEAEDGASGIKMLNASADIDLIITDLQMKPLDGIEFTRMVRTARDSRKPFVPILMITAHTESFQIVTARDTGVNEFLAKPISARALYARLVAVVTRPRPFIRSKTYVGPCRRRRKVEWKGPERRRPVDGAQ